MSIWLSFMIERKFENQIQKTKIRRKPDSFELVYTKIENCNYLNVAFISYKLTMWDLMLISGCHTRGQRLRKKTVLVSHRIYW